MFIVCGANAVIELTKEKQEAAASSFWEPRYYSSYFNIDSEDVIGRVVGSVWPVHAARLGEQLKGRGDLYGCCLSRVLWFASLSCRAVLDCHNARVCDRHGGEHRRLGWRE